MRNGHSYQLPTGPGSGLIAARWRYRLATLTFAPFAWRLVAEQDGHQP